MPVLLGVPSRIDMMTSRAEGGADTPVTDPGAERFSEASRRSTSGQAETGSSTSGRPVAVTTSSRSIRSRPMLVCPVTSARPA